MSVPRDVPTFGNVLRDLRLEAGLTQEALAERSGVSVRSIQHLEADSNRPRRSTATSLAQALRLSDDDRRAFEIAAERAHRERIIESTPRGDPREVAVASVPATVSPFPTEAAFADRDRGLAVVPRPVPTNLPWPVTSVIGREADLAAIRNLLTVDHQRLVTLIGVGGSGKTRLAVQIGQELVESYGDGVWFVDLAPTSSPTLVPRMVAGALSVREVPGASLLDTLLGFLQRKHLLLVLDNCEHLIDACAELADRLLTTCPDLSILATSREPLQIVGERQWRVRPLPAPEAGSLRTFEDLARFASVRLFQVRAQAIDAGFQLTEANAATVGQICTHLDGIPLAIELAASRTGVLAVQQIADRLDDCFQVLVGSTQARPTRQQTMQAALTWSYDLLTPAEQATFRSLSVFAAGFDLDAAQAVCRAEPFGDLDVIDLLGRLVDKSLVVAEEIGRRRRYRLLEPVRQYAHRVLLSDDEEQGTRSRHFAHYAALAEQAALLLHGPEQIRWLDRLEAERDNLRAALNWIADHGDIETGLRLAVAMTPYWHARGYLSEGRSWLEAMLAATRPGMVSPSVRAEALISAGFLAVWQGDLERSETVLAEALASAQERADRHAEARARIWLATTFRRMGAAERALALGEEGLRLGQEVGDEAVIASALFHVGITFRDTQQTDRAVAVLDQCVRSYQRLGDAHFAAIASTMLGWAMLEAGHHSRAFGCLRESAITLKTVGDQSFTVFALRGLAYASQASGESHRAARWYGASEALRRSLGMQHPPRSQARDRMLVAALQEQLTASAYDEAYASGEALGLDDLLAEIVAAR